MFIFPKRFSSNHKKQSDAAQKSFFSLSRIIFITGIIIFFLTLFVTRWNSEGPIFFSPDQLTVPQTQQKPLFLSIHYLILSRWMLDLVMVYLNFYNPLNNRLIYFYR